MGNLNPTLSEIGVQGPAQAAPSPSLVGISRGLEFLGAMFNSRDSGSKPTEKDKFAQYFQPYQKKIIAVMNSDLSDVDKKRQLEKIFVEANVALPQYSSMLKQTAAQFGLDSPVVVDPAEEVNKGFQEWLKTPSGVSSFQKSVVVRKDGTIDQEATNTKLKQMYFADQQLKAKAEELALLKRAQGDKSELFKLKSERLSRELMQHHFDANKNIVSSLLGALKSGRVGEVPELADLKKDIETNNYQGLMAKLRIKRAEVEAQVRQDFVQAGLSPDVYDRYVQEAMKPIDLALTVLEKLPEDTQNAVKVVQGMAELEVTSEGMSKLGAIAGTRAGVKAMAEASVSVNTNDFISTIKGMSKKGKGLTFAETFGEGQPKGLDEQTFDNPATAARVFGKAVEKTNIQSQPDVEAVPDLLSKQLHALAPEASPLDSNGLKAVMSPQYIVKLRDIIRRNDSVGVNTKVAFTYLVDDQITKNISIMSLPDGVSLVYKNGKVELTGVKDFEKSAALTMALVPGAELFKGPEVINLKRAQEAVKNINYLLSSVDQIGDEAIKRTVENSLKALGVAVQEEAQQPQPQEQKPMAKLISKQRVEKFLSDPEVKDAIKFSSNIIGIPPEDVLRIIAFETGGSFSTKATPGTSSAIGLFQLTEAAAKDLGIDHSKIKDMTPAEQITYGTEYIRKNLDRAGILMPTPTEAYLALHYPAALGKPSDYVLYEQGSKEYKLNKGLDANKDGKVTVADVEATIMRHKLHKDVIKSINPEPSVFQPVSEETKQIVEKQSSSAKQQQQQQQTQETPQQKQVVPVDKLDLPKESEVGKAIAETKQQELIAYMSNDSFVEDLLSGSVKKGVVYKVGDRYIVLTDEGVKNVQAK